MTALDLKEIMGTSSAHTLSLELKNKIENSAIVNIHTVTGECFKIKGDKYTRIIAITPDYITIRFDSHVSDVMYSAIEHIDYYGGKYGRDND